MSSLPLWAHSRLRDMARQSGVQEYGGLGAGWRGQAKRGYKSQREMNDAGTGRTVWIRHEWCKGSGYSQSQIVAIVEKAISGQRLGRRQSALIETMIAELGVDEQTARWHTMTEDEKEDALDELFGADSRPKNAAKSQEKSAGAGSADAEKASPALAEPARPTQPGKAEPHFPAQDRQRETAVIYAMPKAKPEEKRAVGRPALPGRRVVIKLDEKQIERAAKLGGGNVAAGIRKALRG